METNRPDEVARVLKELDEIVNETARLQEAVESAQHPESALASDRRRNERRSVVDDRRSGERRKMGDPPPDL